MKFLAFVVCMTVFAAVHGKRFEKDCIQLDVEGTVTVTAHNTNTNETDKAVIDLSTVKVEEITGNCTNVNTSVMMNVAFNKASSWKLEFTNGAKVQLDQSVTFDPAVLFKNCSANASVTLPNAARLALSASNESFECDSQQSINFTPKTEGNCSFSISQNISSIRVQAFGLHNGTYSPAEHCAADQSTVAPTTEATTVPATTVPVPTGKPVTQETFLLKDSKGVVCFRLEAGLQFTVEYETTDNVTAYSKLITVPGSAKVNGTCATGSANTATMTISEDDYSLAITETRDKSASSSAVQLTVKLDPANFPKALHANSTVTFEVKGKFQQSTADTFYLCDTEQTLKLTSTNTSSATLYANNVKMQAFNLKNGSFSGEGVRCGLDPTPQPKPGYNTYVVEDNNTACIVLKGEISFSNVTYATKSGSTLANTINIPEMNKTSDRVTFNGSCNLEGGNAQQLVITFNTNWTLTLTFVKGSSKDSSMLTAAADEFTVRDIEFVYYLVPKFFPNTTTPNQRVVASQINITGDFMKGSIKGGSYKCDAQQSETLDTGVQFQTTNLQFKAFNNDNTTTFNSNVSECSADDESNSIVPIAVGAALAGLVAIVLIAYLIGRRRSRRQGYESV